MAADEQGLKTLTYYALDRASPFNLKMFQSTDTLEKLFPYTMIQMQIVAPTGIKDVWLTINAYAGNYGGKSVAPDASMKCKTTLDVWNAVRGAAGLPPASA